MVGEIGMLVLLMVGDLLVRVGRRGRRVRLSQGLLLGLEGMFLRI